MKEKQRLEDSPAWRLRAGDLIYFEEVSVPKKMKLDDDDVVWCVQSARRSGGVMYLVCAGRGADSDVYFNVPGYRFHFMLPADAALRTVVQP